MNAGDLSASEKERIGKEMLTKDKSPAVMSAELGMNVNTMKKYKRMVKNGVSFRRQSGQPPLIDELADSAIRQYCSKSLKCQDTNGGLAVSKKDLSEYIELQYKLSLARKRNAEYEEDEDTKCAKMGRSTKKRYVDKYYKIANDHSSSSSS